MRKINENLQADDLKNMIKKVFGIDSYKSKIGDDESMVVLSFSADNEDSAKDLENFVEMGYDFVLDADVTPGENDDSTYTIFIELERNRHVAEQIFELLSGIELLTGMDDMRFRYFKSFKSQDATLENLEATIPTDKNSYDQVTNENSLNNFSKFFADSYANELSVLDESITFKRIWAEPISFDIIASGRKADVYASISGPIMLESAAISQVLFFTKYIGNYNITKINNTFIFENRGWAVALGGKHG